LQQHLQANREAAAVLAGLAAWLPQDIIDTAAAAAAGTAGAAGGSGAGGDSAASEPAAVGENAGSNGVVGAAEGSGSSGAAGVSGVWLWREEARVAMSVVELVGQLEGTWGDLLDRLEQAQVGAGCVANWETCREKKGDVSMMGNQALIVVD